MQRVGKYFTIARVSLQSTLAYRASVLSKCVFYTMFIYVFMRLWTSIYQTGSVNGYTLTQIVWYLIMTELIAFGFSTGIYSAMNDEVKDGSIAYLIVRPTHYVFYQLANAMGQVAFNVVLFGLLASALGLVFAGPLPAFALASLPAIGVSVLLGVLINFFFHMLIGLSAFVLEDNFALYLIYQKLTFMLGVFLPVEFLPGWLQAVAKNLPFSYAAWAPARLFVDFSWPLFWALVPRQLLWLSVTFAAAMLAYRGGVRRLQTNGG